MKKIVSIILLLTLFFCTSITEANIIPETDIGGTSFKDIDTDDWFYDAVNEICSLGLMKGTSEDTFSPYEAVTRAAAVQVLYTVSGEKYEYYPEFSDVTENSWYAEAVCWAKDKEITNGTSKNKFSPSLLLTREQLACLIDRFAEAYGIENKNAEQDKYSDMHNVSEWALDSVTKMYEKGIMTPRNNGFFVPNATVSRAEFAAFILNLTGEGKTYTDDSAHVELVYPLVAEASLETGQSIDINGRVYPENATDPLIRYSSSDNSIVKIGEKGSVTALSKGEVTITLASRDGGFKAYCKITVSDKPSLGMATDHTYASSIDTSLITSMGRKIDPNKPMVALTYDDGPHRTYSARILDTLEKYNSAATFFELGDRCENNGDILRRAVNIGCEIGNHSYSHPNLASLSAGGISNQINTTNDIIYNATGIYPALVRPPYGSNGSNVRNNVNAPIILWSIDTLDWKYRNESYVTSVIKNNVTDGSVILMHSLYSSTASATEVIVPWLISQGYQIVTVSELAEARGIELQKGKVYTDFYK